MLSLKNYPENRPSEMNVVPQASMFRCELLVLGRVKWKETHFEVAMKIVFLI